MYRFIHCISRPTHPAAECSPPRALPALSPLPFLVTRRSHRPRTPHPVRTRQQSISSAIDASHPTARGTALAACQRAAWRGPRCVSASASHARRALTCCVSRRAARIVRLLHGRFPTPLLHCLSFSQITTASPARSFQHPSISSFMASLFADHWLISTLERSTASCDGGGCASSSLPTPVHTPAHPRVCMRTCIRAVIWCIHTSGLLVGCVARRDVATHPTATSRRAGMLCAAHRCTCAAHVYILLRSPPACMWTGGYAARSMCTYPCTLTGTCFSF